MTLNTDTSETISDTYGGGGSVSLVGHMSFAEKSGGNCTVTCPSGIADGDVIVLIQEISGTNASWSATGWTMYTAAHYAAISLQAGWRIWHTGDPTSFTVAAPGYVVFYSWWVFRGCDHTSPISAMTYAGGGNTTSMVIPSITTPAANCILVVGFNKAQTHTIAAPSGWINVDQGGGDPYGYGASKAVAAAGATGSQAFACAAGSSNWAGMMICLQPSAGMSGSYYRWENAEAVAFGWGYKLDPTSPGSAYRSGMVEGGYRIEVRYPTANGGTLAGTYQVKIMTYASVFEDSHEWSPSARPLVIVYPCEYTQEPAPGSTPVDTPPVSECTVTADLASIAAAICALKVQMSILLNYDVYMTQLIGEMYGPHTAIVGQAQESIMAPLGQFTALALAAMSNYAPSGSTTRLIAAGVTGDWSGATLGGGILIEIQTMPGTTGHRESTPPLYEVNERARQLGWLTFAYDGMMTGHQQVVYTEQYIKAPTTVEALVWVHLMVGVTADVYEVTETYTPTVGA